MNSIKYAVFVNLAANNGRAARRWEQISASVLDQLPEGTQVVVFQSATSMESAFKNMLDEGVQVFVSAGGDGSANYLLNSLMQLTGEHVPQLWLGGIGLGSSNDFIKPKQHFIQGIPTRLNWATAKAVDVGKADYLLPTGQWQSRFFIANASLGVTAEANWFFNHGDWFLRATKDRWVDAAILYAAVRTILGFRNFQATLDFNGKLLETKLSNLAVLKSAFVSGSFHFDDPVQQDDGFLGLNVCLDMTKMELLRVLIGLARGQFRGLPKTRSEAIRQLKVRMSEPVALEMDGEVFQTTEVHFSVRPKAIHLLGL